MVIYMSTAVAQFLILNSLIPAARLHTWAENLVIKAYHVERLGWWLESIQRRTYRGNANRYEACRSYQGCRIGEGRSLGRSFVMMPRYGNRQQGERGETIISSEV